MQIHKGILSALAAAALFGASTPIAKQLVGEIPPVLLAGLLYTGSGVGLAIALLARRVTHRGDASAKFQWPRGIDLIWLTGAIVFGGLLGPVSLMTGLQYTAASSSALLLNLESVFTALLAWFVFRENFDRRIALGMVLIVAGGLVLSWTPGELAVSTGAVLIAVACLCWAIDNNLTRKISANDAMIIASIKGLVAGLVNVAIAMVMGAKLPPSSIAVSAALVGFAGYGVSLTLFVIALRELGTARTGAYFSVAPFFGAALAVLVQGEPITVYLAIAAVLMGLGVWLHVSEAHEHSHLHATLEHSHSHVHDVHHQHRDDANWDSSEPHTHAHVHEPIRHRHPHYPDIHHLHEH